MDEVFRSLDTTRIFRALSDIQRSLFDPRLSGQLLFLDEIQSCPQSIPALRAIQEDFPDLPVVSAGSLLEFILEDHEFSMPVGRVEYMHIGPIRFEDFLEAHGADYLVERIRELRFDRPETWPTPVLHDEAMSHVQNFLFCGGMPEAAAAFLDSDGDPRAVSPIHACILDTYCDDMSKYARRSALPRVHAVFDFLAAHPCQKIKYSTIAPDHLARDVKQALKLLFQARVATPVFHTSCAGLPLEAGKAENTYKSIFLDVGLHNSAVRADLPLIRSLKGDQLLGRGAMVEQFVGQHLLYRDEPYRTPLLHYWLREGKKGNAEVDFVIGLVDSMVAIEVKAGAGGHLRSLRVWEEESVYPKKTLLRLNSHLPKREGTILSLPIYCLEQATRILGI